MTSGFARVLVVTGLVVLGSVPLAAQTPRLRVGGDIQPPARVVYVEPVYPEQAKADGLSGMVILELVIGTDGKVLETSVIRSLHPLLDAAASEAARQWEFTPTQLYGEAVELILSVSVTFSLANDHGQRPSGPPPPPPPPPPAR